ncbi:MAG: choice-of-anchor U domain-containing protein [Thiohalomonadales bacterium]
MSEPQQEDLKHLFRLGLVTHILPKSHPLETPMSFLLFIRSVTRYNFLFNILIAALISSPFTATISSAALVIDNLKPGEWYEVPASNLRAVQPVPLPPGRSNAIIEAWNGGAFDTKRDRLIVWGGGHGDYAGNEVYVFDMTTLKWIRLNDPSSLVGFCGGETCSPGDHIMPDGSPTSRHTYNGLQYLPNQDLFFAQGGSLWENGFTSDLTWTFNFTNLTWQQKATAIESDYEVMTAYDPISGNVFHHGSYTLAEYDPVADTWTTRSGQELFTAGGQTAVIDPENRLFVAIGRGDGGVRAFYYDLTTTGTLVQQNLQTSGDTEIESSKAPGLVYDTASKQIIAWGADVNGVVQPQDVYSLTLSKNPTTGKWTGSWTKRVPAATNTVTPTISSTVDAGSGSFYSTGTRGRFQYSPAQNVFVLVNHVSENVFIYKLSDGSGTPPTPRVSLSISPDSATTNYNGSVTINWNATNATTCQANWTTSTAAAGSQLVSNITADQQYEMTCFDAQNISATQSTLVTVTTNTINATPADYISKISNLGPGDTLQLAAGTYPNNILLSGLNGTADFPIVISGPESGAPAIVLAEPGCECNTIQLDNASYVVIKNLTVDGNNIPFYDSVNSRNITHHITIENNLFINDGADQLTVSISTKGPAWNWIIRNNTIIGAGTGMYLGNSTGSYPFVAGLIENNLVYDTLGYNLQIKQQNPRTDGNGLPFPGMPTGINKTLIRNNVFSKANNAAVGSLARPNLLVGHFPLSGDGQNDVYEIYGNFFYQNPVDALFQGEGNFGFYNNVMFNSLGTAVNIRPHNDVPRDIRVFNNSIIASATGINITGGSTNFSQRAIGNAVFAGMPISAASQIDNIVDSFSLAGNYVTNADGTVTNPGGLVLNMFPLLNKLNGANIDTTGLNKYTDWNKDFNGNSHDGSYRGAYNAAGANPGWALAIQQKPPTGSNGNTLSISFTASSSIVMSGQSVSLDWNSSNTSSCVASDGWSGTKNTSGSQMSGPITTTTRFVLSCTGTTGGSSSISVTVSVGSASGGISIGSGTIISDTELFDTANAADWSITSNLQNGNTVYGDRAYTFTQIPANLIGQEWVSSANDSKMYNGDNLLSFTVNKNANVFVIHRDDITSKPAWLSSWTDTNSNVGNSEPKTYSVFNRTYLAGSKVFTGSNGGVGSGMYIVVVTTIAPPLPSSDTDADGILDSWEISNFGNLTTATATSDFDGDGLLDIQEATLGSDPRNGTDIPATNNNPLKPSIVSPVSAVPLSTTLLGSTFSDPNPADTLAYSKWEIFDLDNTIMVFQRNVSKLQNLTLPLGTLTINSNYTARVLHVDNNGYQSSWSDPINFSTQSSDVNDLDGNGTDDRYQANAGTDSDNNGTSDIDQENLCNLLDAQTGQTIYMTTSQGRIQCLSSYATSDLPTSTVGNKVLPVGMFAFRIHGLPIDISNPATVNIEVNLPQLATGKLIWYKYDISSDTLSNFSSNAVVTNDKVSISLVDGGDGDADGVINGVIVDPSGPVIEATPVATNPKNGKSNAGAINWWLLIIAAISFSLYNRQRRRQNLKQ